MTSDIDIRENDIFRQDPVLLETLLIDRSRPKNGSKKPAHIIWATDNYAAKGPAYAENEQITAAAITGPNGDLIQPRVKKTKEEQQARARDKGEVFTPSWICNAQNNLIDKEWFGTASPFNEETDKGNFRPIPRAYDGAYRVQDRHVCAANRRAVPDDADGAGTVRECLRGASRVGYMGCAKKRVRVDDCFRGSRIAPCGSGFRGGRVRDLSVGRYSLSAVRSVSAVPWLLPSDCR